MTAYFLDSSAGVKLYATEIGSSRVIEMADPSRGHEPLAAQITVVEIAAALFRRVRNGQTSMDAARRAVTLVQADFTSIYRIVEVGAALLDEAVEIAERHGLRGFDCLQLASAVTIARGRFVSGSTPVILVSADVELNRAAEAEGIRVENPNDFPSSQFGA